jgi:lipopolysaccharide transport system permease protein
MVRPARANRAGANHRGAVNTVATRLRQWDLGSARYFRSHGKLLYRVTRNDMAARHAGSHLGIGWIFLAPLLVLAIYSLIYLEIFKVRVAGLNSTEYVLYIFCGLVPYLATAEALATGVTSVLTNKSVLNNTVFPIDLTPVKAALSAQAIMIVGLAVVVAGALATGNAHSTLVLLPFVWALHLAWLIGVNWFISLLNVIFRDLQNLLNAILMIMLVASPIAYTPDMVPASLKPLLAINPFAYFVVAYQQVIMLGIYPSIPHAALLVLMAVVAFVLGSWFFDRAKRVIVDYV